MQLCASRAYPQHVTLAGMFTLQEWQYSKQYSMFKNKQWEKYKLSIHEHDHWHLAQRSEYTVWCICCPKRHKK